MVVVAVMVVVEEEEEEATHLRPCCGALPSGGRMFAITQVDAVSHF